MQQKNSIKPEGNTQGALHGLSVLFCGDSIGTGHYDDNPDRSWSGRIARSHGILADNRCCSGWAFSTIRHPEHRILAQLQSAKDNHYDMIILQGGVNDAWGTDEPVAVAPVGSVTDSFDVKDYDITTFAGALEEFLYYARQYFPKATLAYMFSFYMPEANVGRVSDMEEYYAAAAEICKKWNVPYLDMYHDHHLNYDVLEIQSSVCLQDPVHPNTEGYNRLAPHIAAWMETLV